MDNQLKRNLRAFFEADFSSITEFEDRVITPIFGDLYDSKPIAEDLLSGEEELSQLAEEAKIKGLSHVGTISVRGGNNVEVFDVTVANGVNLSRSRVNIQRVIRSRLMYYTHAFMIFHYEDTQDKEWRFSYAYKRDTISNITDAKRYTYLLGKNQHCRTASERFAELAALQTVADEDIIKAFSVSALTKEFYDELFKWYEWATADESKVTFPNLASNPDDDRDDLDIKVIRLITRIIFVWFIKHKELVPEKLFDTEYLRNVLKDFDPESTESGNYYNAILQNLFFATLNSPIIDEKGQKRRFAEVKNNRDVKNLYRYDELFEITKDQVIEMFSEIPFLNGGLFECLDKVSTQTEVVDDIYAYDGFSRNDNKFPDGRYKHRAFVPNCLFFDSKKGLIPILSRYNFTIEENTPSDQDVALDPELLGHVFENLLGVYNPETEKNARNSSGSFYTPREVVNYMVDESLVAYLGDNQTVRDLFHETFEMDINKQEEYKKIASKLKQVRILDPACGSGAFPMGLLNRIVTILGKIEPHKDIYQLKLDIINNCIYGSDLQSIAIQISKLRFFISLICEIKKDPQKPNYGIPTLPNLETKFVTADALLHIKKVEQRSLFTQGIDEVLSELKEVRAKHFSADSNYKKKNLREKDDELRRELAQILSREEIVAVEDAEKLVNWNPYNQTSVADFFDPEWMFGLKDGFDIVIGNPPYIQLQNNGGELRKKYVNENYLTFSSSGDIYTLFYERGYELLKQNGHLCFITSNKWMRANYGDKTRKFFSEKTNPLILIDFPGTGVFESATVDVNILLFEKASNKGDTTCAVVKREDKAVLTNLSLYIEQKNTKYNFRNIDEIWVALSPIEQSIKAKIEAIGTPLKDWNIQIFRGVLTGYNKAFIITTEKRNEILSNCLDKQERERTSAIIRPILRGRDIKRYSYNWANLWLINTHNGVSNRIPRVEIENFPAVKKHLDEYWDKISVRADQGDTPYNLRNCAYMEELSRPKIIYQELSQGSSFAYDENGDFMVSNSGYLITGSHLKYLLNILNSKVLEYLYVTFYGTKLGSSGVRWLAQNVTKIPVPLYEGSNLQIEIAKASPDDDIDGKIKSLYGINELI